MEDQLSEDERMLRDAARAFAEATLQPVVRDAYATEAEAPELFVQMGEAGLLGVTIPEEFGGLGAGPMSRMDWWRGRSSVSTAAIAA